jgi:hypothetical protein
VEEKTVDNDRDLVPFLIGARINKLWPLPLALPILAKMRRMQIELLTGRRVILPMGAMSGRSRDPRDFPRRAYGPSLIGVGPTDFRLAKIRTGEDSRTSAGGRVLGCLPMRDTSLPRQPRSGLLRRVLESTAQGSGFNMSP